MLICPALCFLLSCTTTTIFLKPATLVAALLPLHRRQLNLNVYHIVSECLFCDLTRHILPRLCSNDHKMHHSRATSAKHPHFKLPLHEPVHHHHKSTIQATCNSAGYCKGRSEYRAGPPTDQHVHRDPRKPYRCYQYTQELWNVAKNVLELSGVVERTCVKGEVHLCEAALATTSPRPFATRRASSARCDDILPGTLRAWNTTLLVLCCDISRAEQC